MRVPSDIVWKPDLVLSNNIDGHYDKTVPVNALLNYTGIVEWIPPSIYKSSCSIQVEYFPFDWQNCTLRFRSFTYSTKEVWLHSVYSKAVVDREAYTDNGEWKVIHCPIKVNHDPRDDGYQDITLYFIIQRKPLFYIINIIIPCVLISSLSVLVFYLPSGCSEKTNMSISVLLGLPVYLLLLAKRVPETSLGVPLIGAYLLFTMLSVTFSVIFSVIVLNIYHRSPATHDMRPWVRMIFIKFLPPLLHMDSSLPTPPCYHYDGDCEKTTEETNLDEKTEKVKSKEVPQMSVDCEKATDLDGQSNQNTGDLKNVANGPVRETSSKVDSSTKHTAKPSAKISLLNTFRLPRTKRSSNSQGRIWNSVNGRTSDRAIYREFDGTISASGMRNSVGNITPILNSIRIYPSPKDVQHHRVYYARAAEGRNRVFMSDCTRRDSASSPAELQPILSKQLPEGVLDEDESEINVMDSESGANAVASTGSSGHREYFRLTCNDRKSTYKARNNYSSQASHGSISPTKDVYFNIEPSVVDGDTEKPIEETLTRPSAQKQPTATLECASGLSAKSNIVVLGHAGLPDHLHKTEDTSMGTQVSEDFETNCASETACRVRSRKSHKITGSPFHKHVVHTLPEKANECLDAVNFICQHIRNENDHKAKIQEWQMVAMVLDRLMFWIFFLIYVTGSLYFAIEALTNFPPDHPFFAGDQKFVGC